MKKSSLLHLRVQWLGLLFDCLCSCSRNNKSLTLTVFVVLSCILDSFSLGSPDCSWNSLCGPGCARAHSGLGTTLFGMANKSLSIEILSSFSSLMSPLPPTPNTPEKYSQPVCFLSLLWTLPDASGCSLSPIHNVKTSPSHPATEQPSWFLYGALI